MTGLTNSRVAPAGARPKVRVLLADDEEGIRRSIGRWLRRQGHEVIEAENGQAAVDAAAESQPDLAIVDLDMPGIDGFQVVRILKSTRGNDLPVLVLSGEFEPARRVMAFEAGADDFISKPVYMPELIKRIEAFHRTFQAYSTARQAHERADRLRLYASEASALLAHDLNNGLTVAISNLGFAGDVVEIDDEGRDAIESALRALRRMAVLVKNFVDIGRLEDAALVPKRATVRVRDLLERIASIHLPSRKARLRIDCPADLEASVDPILFERVLHNLVGNACRYVYEGGLVRIRTNRDGDALLLEVGNNGPRISEEQRGTLFEKYRAGTDQKAMTGMGLYFCRLACEAHGGSIRLAEDEELDVNFLARFPAAP